MLTTHGVLWKGLSTLWKGTPTESVTEVWKDFTSEGAIVITEKSRESHQARNNKFLLEKSPDVVCDFLGFITQPVGETMRKIRGLAKMAEGREGGGGF